VQQLTANLFLTENKWVSDAAVSQRGAGHGDVHIDLEISPDGHDLICDHGMRAFELKIQEKLSSIDFQGIPWTVCSPNAEIWGQPDLKSTRRFPLVLSRLDDFTSHRLLISITSDLDCFRGHFPDNPILAGVTQLHWAACASCFLYGFDEPPMEVKHLKFKNVVSPPMILELSLSKIFESEIQFGFASPGQVHSEGRLVFDGEITC
jgi:3-hydroxymyristoyl/3-hydroxydecanoyl-(acyl carrier protein) dehydratase